MFIKTLNGSLEAAKLMCPRLHRLKEMMWMKARHGPHHLIYMCMPWNWALRHGIAQDRSEPPALLLAFWSRICNGHSTGQHLYDHLIIWPPPQPASRTACASTEVQPRNRVLMIHQEEHHYTVPTSASCKTLTKILQEYFWWEQQTCEITQSPGSLVGGQGKCFLGETVGGLLLILQGPSS